MPNARQFKETRIVNCSKERAYSIVKAIDKYPEFVPWCISTEQVAPPEGAPTDANVEYWRMAAGFKYVKDSYISKVTFQPNEQITAEAIDANLLNNMITIWRFEDPPSLEADHDNLSNTDRCLLRVDIDFEFNSYLYSWIANFFFLQITDSMIKAFIARIEPLQ